MNTQSPATLAKYTKAYFALQGSRGGKKAKQVMSPTQLRERALKASHARKSWIEKYKTS